MSTKQFEFRKYLVMPAEDFPTDPSTGCIDKSKLINYPLVTVRADDAIVFSRNLPISDSKKCRDAIVDISGYPCDTVTVEIEGGDSDSIDSVYLTDTLDGIFSYDTPDRPRAHFSWRQGHMGDIVGLTYNGKWHFFSIYNPISGPEIAWGHAESDDLVHWTEKAPLFDPKHVMYNGIGFIDHANLLGKNREGIEPIVLMIPRMKRGICYAYSYDGNVFHTDIDPTPIFPYGDAPKLYYSERISKWVCYVKDGFREIHQYLSDDLKNWTRVANCPAIAEVNMYEGDPGQLFDMYVDGNPDNKVTLMLFGLGGYLLGHYEADGMHNLNGEPIRPEDMLWDGHYGYPSVFANAPDNRIIGISNLGNSGIGGIPNFEYDYKHIATFPVEYTLKNTEHGIRLFMLPVKEIENLYTERTLYLEKSTEKEILLSTSLAAHIKGNISNIEGHNFTIYVGDYGFSYDHENCSISLLDTDGSILHTLGRACEMDRQHLLCEKIEQTKEAYAFEMIVDLNSVEVFFDAGRYSLMCGRLPLQPNAAGGIDVRYTTPVEREVSFITYTLGNFVN